MITKDTRMVRIAALQSIPAGEGRVFLVEGVPVAIFHARSGKVYASQPDCPHRGGPLADGLTGGDTLVCPLHGWKFNLETGKGQNCSIQTYHVETDSSGYILMKWPQITGG